MKMLSKIEKTINPKNKGIKSMLYISLYLNKFLMDAKNIKPKINIDGNNPKSRRTPK